MGEEGRPGQLHAGSYFFKALEDLEEFWCLPVKETEQHFLKVDGNTAEGLELVRILTCEYFEHQTQD